MIEKQLVKEYPNKPKVKNPTDIVELCEDIRDSEIETLAVFMMDARMKVIHREILSIGNIDSAIMCPREIFKRAFKSNAHSLILVHNHPSGDASPSDADKSRTDDLVKAGELLNIPIHDHIIVTADSFRSIMQEEV